MTDNEKTAYEIGKEQATLAIANMKQRGPMAASISASEFRRGFNEIIAKAIKAISDGSR